jgi:hypothetical protein
MSDIHGIHLWQAWHAWHAEAGGGAGREGGGGGGARPGKGGCYTRREKLHIYRRLPHAPASYTQLHIVQSSYTLYKTPTEVPKNVDAGATENCVGSRLHLGSGKVQGVIFENKFPRSQYGEAIGAKLLLLVLQNKDDLIHPFEPGSREAAGGARPLGGKRQSPQARYTTPVARTLGGQYKRGHPNLNCSRRDESFSGPASVLLR